MLIHVFYIVDVDVADIVACSNYLSDGEEVITSYPNARSGLYKMCMSGHYCNPIRCQHSMRGNDVVDMTPYLLLLSFVFMNSNCDVRRMT